MKSAPAGSELSPLASPLQRIGAALIDIAVLLAADVVLTTLLVVLLPPERVYDACLAMATCCSLLYLVLLWARGQTLGKRIFAIKIIGPHGQRPGLLRGLLRFAGYVIASLPFKIGLLPILWDPLRRGWHDQIAGTLVVKEHSAEIPAPPRAEPVTPYESAPGSIRWSDLAMLPVFALATALVTWPVIARLPAFFPSDGSDANIFTWSLWWTRKALLDPRLSVWDTNYIFWPQNINLRLHSFSLFNCALGVPLQTWFSPTLTYTLLLLFEISLTAFAAYLLGKYITGSAVGGFLAGLFFGFCPYIIWHSQAHLDLASSEFIVLYALLILIVLKKARLRHAVAAAVALALAGLCAWHQLTYLAVFTVVFAATWLAVHHAGVARRILLIGFGGAIGLALLAVWLVPMAREFRSGKYEQMRLNARLRADILSLDVASLTVPPPYHPAFGRWTAKVYYGGLQPKGGVEQAGYLGWSVLALALIALWERRRRRAHLPWLATAIAFVILSLGFRLSVFRHSAFPVWWFLIAGGPPGSGLQLPIVPSLAVRMAMALVSGSPYLFQSAEMVDLPFSMLWKIGGVMRLASAPGRFVEIANLSLALLAAVGALHLARLATARRGRWAGGLLTAALAAIVMFEYLIAPRFPMEPAAFHQFYHQLARERGCQAILEVSIAGLDDSHFVRAQTFHGKRLYGGAVSRPPDYAHDFINRHPLLSKALKTEMFPMPGRTRLGISLVGRVGERTLRTYRADLRALARTGYCYIVLHKQGIEPASLRQAEQLLGTQLRLPVALNDPELLVYRVPRRGGSRTAPASTAGPTG